MNTTQQHKAGLPIRRSLTLIYALALIIAVLMAAASVAGLLYRAVIYPTDDLLQSFVPSDVVNLLIGLPILLGSMWLARRGKLIGLLSLFSPKAELIGHAGASNSFLFHSDVGQLYIAGTLNQLHNQGRPFRLMLKVVSILGGKAS